MFSRDLKEIIGGFALLVVGVVFLNSSLAYRFGTATQMGPGYYPGVISGIVILLAVLIIVSGFMRRIESIPEVSWRPLIAVTTSIVVFAISMRYLGLLPAILFSTIVSSLGDSRSRILTALMTSIVLSIGAWLIFSIGLGLPLPLVRGVF